MENFIRLPANESDFSISALRGENLVSFNLPANSSSYDLSQSYVAINFSTKTTQTTALTNNDGAVATETQSNIQIKFNESAPNAARQNTRQTGTANGQNFDSNVVPSVVMVKNAKFFCEKGQVENLRKVGTLRTTLESYVESRFEKLKDINQLNQSPYPQPFGYQSTKNLSSFGNDPSEDVLFETRIPLRDIFNIGKVKAWNTNVYGETQIQLELNLNKLVLADPMVTDNVYAKLDVSAYTTAAYKSMLGSPARAGGNGVNTLGTETFPLVSSIVYNDIRDIPYYVGQKVTVSAVDSVAGAISSVSQIASIDLVDATALTGITLPANVRQNNRIKITLTGGCMNAIADGSSLTQVELAPVAATTSALLCNNIELVAKRSSVNPSGAIQYTTYMSQEDVVPSASSISRTYQLPANTTNVYVMFPNPVFSNEDLDTYRFSLDDEMVYNRDIKYHSPLHYDLISNLFANQGKVMKDLGERYYASVVNTGTALTTQKLNFADITFIGVPVKLKNEPTLFGIDLVGGGNVNLSGKIIVYSEVIKQI